MAKFRMPAELGQAGQQLWRLIVDRDPPYTLRPDEWWLLAQACSEADIIAKLELALAEDVERKLQEDPDLGASAGMTAKGSMGQVVINPMIPELRAHRTTLAALLKALKLPDVNEGGNTQNNKVSEQARAAARARWGAPKGA